MAFIAVFVIYVIVVALMLRFFGQVHLWDEEVGKMITRKKARQRPHERSRKAVARRRSQRVSFG
ncbi:MAG: hypothetical protein HYY49_00220 [Ignavibacteriales bacterium]|nr:hypothetical protein [Ignavibacteriales bacterium]